MTRKKSNVKALALAVTCAILAGGYSGLNPVYAAADTLYKEGANVTTSNTASTGGGSNTAIEQLTVGGVTIGGTGGDAGQIIAKNIVGITNSSEGTVNDIHINGATFASGGAITANGGLTTNSVNIGGLTISSLASGSTTSATNYIAGIKDSSGAVTAIGISGTKFESNGAITASSLKLDDGIHPINNVAEAIGNNKDNITTLQTKTTNISYNATTGTTVDGVVLKDKGITAADGKFTVKADGQTVFTGDPDDKGKTTIKNGETVVEGANGKVTINNGGIEIAQKAQDTGENYSIKLDSGYVEASGYVKAPKFYIDNDNKFEKNSLSVAGVDSLGNPQSVKIGNGGIMASGDVAAHGALYAAENKFTVSKEGAVSAANGKFKVNTDGTVKINEGADQQVIIDSNGIKVGTGSAYINNDGFKAGADGKNSLTTSGLTATTIKAGTNNTEFIVDADGAVSAAGGKFGVDKDGNTTVGGKLNSKGNFSVGDNDEFTVDATNGNVVSKGKITSEKAKIGAVEIANDGTITGVKAITTDTLTVNNGFITNGNIESKGLKVNGNAEITGTLGVNGAVTGASFNGAFITATTFNGATIDATHFNNVTLSGGNVEANSIKGTTVTGTTVTDGAGASMNAGTVKGTTITDGSGFTATGGNVSAKDVTATGTVKGTTVTDGVAKMSGGKVTAQNGVEVDANNYLNSSGLKTSNIDASKAMIGKIKIEGSQITSTEADGSVGLAGITVNNAGALNNVTSIDGVAVSGSAASGLTVGTGATAVTIGGNSMALSSTNFGVDNDGDVIGRSFTAGTSYLKDGELKLNDANIWNTAEGIKAEKAVIGANTLDAAGISTTGTLGVKGQATFGDSTSGNYTTVNGGKVDITANGGTTTIEGSKITTKTLDVEDIILRNEMKDGTGATINIKGSDGSMSVASGNFAVDKDGQLTNKITGTAGGYSYETKLETSKSGIKANYTNAINGNQNIIDMGANGISIGVAGTTPSVGVGFKAELDAATMGYGTANSIVVNKDTIKSALGTDVTRVMTNSATEKSIVDKVGTAKRSLKAEEIVDEVAGMTITTNNTGTTFSNGTNTTLINGSAITSTNGGATGVLNGSNLTLTNGTNKTELEAGKVTFKSANAGQYGGTKTTIDGGVITTDTLNVQRINLGKEMVNGDGTTTTVSNLSIDEYGNIKAAGGNFTVDGTNKTNPGALHNKVGNTYLDTTETGASMKFDNTAAGGVKSEVAVADNSAKISAGTSSIEVKNDGITNTGKTTFKGAVDGSVPTTETTIDGNTIKTGHLITDKLTITGSGAAAGAGSGSIAFGGDGSITSNIQDAATGKEATFKTNADGTFTEAKDGANVTTNTVNAQGNTNVVTDGTNTSTATQTATSIGGVVTNGTVTMKQELTADGLKLEQTGYDEVNIAKGDVTVKNNRNTATPNQEVHLSDLGSLNNLDSELTARDEYKDNKTAVGAINAEAGIRREEVARLDNRIDDVNNRVDKVGAMAAAIASLKSIGYDPQAPSEFSIGLGQYKGETGVAMGFFHYPNKNFMINVSLSTAGGETMGGIGATWRFGHKSPQKLLDEQREAQAKKELAAAEKYQAAAKLAKEAQERAEYAAKLARQAQVSADNAKAAADATQAKHFQ